MMKLIIKNNKNENETEIIDIDSEYGIMFAMNRNSPFISYKRDNNTEYCSLYKVLRIVE